MRIYSIDEYRKPLSDSEKEQLIRDVVARRLVYDMTRGADELNIEELAERFGNALTPVDTATALMVARHLLVS